MDDETVVGGVAAHLVDEGVLLESARGPVANVALVVSEPIRGSWWAHPQSHPTFATINALADSPDVTRMRLINRRITARSGPRATSTTNARYCGNVTSAGAVTANDRAATPISARRRQHRLRQCLGALTFSDTCAGYKHCLIAPFCSGRR